MKARRLLAALTLILVAACGGVKPPPIDPPPPPPPPPAAQGDLDGVAVGPDGSALELATITYKVNGKALEGEAITIGKPQSDHWCDNRPQPCSPAPRGYFSRPNKEPLGVVVLHIKTADGREGDSKPLAFGANWKPVPITFALPEPPPPPPPPPPPAVQSRCRADRMSKQFVEGFTRSISQYGFMTEPLDLFELDIANWASKGICDIRGWPDFMHVGEANRVFDKNGKPTAKYADFKAKLEILRKYGVTIDVTLQADAYTFVKKGAEGYDITAHKNVVRTLCTDFKNDPVIAFIDVANEGTQRGPGGNGSPQWGHISPGRYTDLWNICRAIDPSRRVTFSSDGEPEFVADEYNKVTERGSRLTPYAPHFPRTSSWADKLGERYRALASKLRVKGPIYMQEEARRGVPGDSNAGPWKASHFITADQQAKAAGATGFCLHNGHWDLSKKPLKDQLDGEENGYVNWVETQTR